MCECGHVGKTVIFANGGVNMGHVGMTLIVAIINCLRKPSAVALSSPQIPRGISRLDLHLNGLLLKLFQQDEGTNSTSKPFLFYR